MIDGVEVSFCPSSVGPRRNEEVSSIDALLQTRVVSLIDSRLTNGMGMALIKSLMRTILSLKYAGFHEVLKELPESQRIRALCNCLSDPFAIMCTKQQHKLYQHISWVIGNQ